MKERPNGKVLIALDPTEPDLRPTPSSLVWIKNWVRDCEASVEAVYVSPPHVGAQITDFAFSDYVNTLNLGKQVNAKILYEKSTSRRAAVDALVQYAIETEADLIVVSSHGRSGPGRVVLGSFAESLMATSPVPLLFLAEGSDSQLPTHSKILFPTDLSETSKRTLDLFLEQISGFSGELILYHSILPPGPLWDAGIFGVPYALPEDYWTELSQWVLKECDLMLKKIVEKGMKVRLIVEDGPFGAASGIEKIAQKENVDLIVMPSVSHGIESAIIGSVGKAVIRFKKWPVWAYGPEAVSKKEEQK